MSRDTPSSLSGLEKAVLIHTGVLLIASAWLFGGNIWWMRLSLSIWASLGTVLTIAAFFQSGSRGRAARRKAWWLAPLALFSGLIFISLTNPSFRPVIIDGETAYIRGTARPFWPSTISPELTLRAWWFGAGVYLSAFNLAAVLQSRSALRGLLVVIAANTLVLAVLGTFQKLSDAGFYFGSAESPNSRFFATFIYYNHWGAFMILGLTTAAGLLFYHTRRYQGRDLWHSPLGLALVGVLLIATSAPVSASRASTVIAAIVLAIAMVHALIHVTSVRRARRLAVWPPLLLIALLAITTTCAVGWLSYRSITERYTETRLVIDAEKSVFGGRAELYRDTWRLAREQPVFGWGLDTYAVGFQLIRPFTVNLRDPNQNAYATAHSDWLQSLAETGFVGTSLLVLMGILPLTALSRHIMLHPLAAYPLLGCALVLLYAWVEFPFANAAVLISFWILLFSAVRHAELTGLVSLKHHE
jgi:O-antigen ligase